MLTRIMLAVGLLSAAAVVAAAQTPVLSSVEAPYPAVQSPVHVAGTSYGGGAVNYGPAGTPLQLIGSNFGSSGTVVFQGYANGIAAGNAIPATVTVWTATTLFLTVPSGATTGLIKVQANGATSNGLPFLVAPGEYSGSCPNYHPSGQLEITTDSLPNGTVSHAYSTTLQASGNSGTLTWSLSSGTLPAGLSLNASSGVISGTPTSATSSPVSLSVTVTDSGSGQTANATLDISVDSATLTAGPVYTYSASYDGVGNVTYYTDSVNGTWSFGYDTLNRLSGMYPAGGHSGSIGWIQTGPNLCLAYDAFGNRTAQSQQTAACPSPGSSVTPTASYNANNQVTWTTVNSAVNGFTYDGAGNVTNDNVNQYLYDPEGRVCAVQSTPIPGSTAMNGYLYDAEGRRIAKGTITSMNCDPAANGFQLTETYVLDQSGEESSQLSTQNGTTTWERSNVYGAGRLLATYDATGLHFHLTDPLGTRRVQTDSNGVAETACQSLPYGDQMNCFQVNNAPQTADNSTPLHFTGKERDTESGNDFFNARYYSSSMGRFLSPDPILQNDLRLLNPQRWNKYAYVINNPLILTDPTGKDAAYVDFSKSAGGAGHAGLISIRSNGTATYSAFMPEGAAAAYAPGKVQTQDLSVTVQFGANGLPTEASYNALIQAVAKINGSDAYNVGIDYFKTTDSETANLDQYIVQKTAAYREGKAPTYKLCFYDCRDYALGGLVAAGVLGKGQAHGFSLDPNSAFWELGINANQQVPPEPKATVTTSECDTLPDGTQRCY